VKSRSDWAGLDSQVLKNNDANASQSSRELVYVEEGICCILIDISIEKQKSIFNLTAFIVSSI
jgi:hypothetical protein